MRIELEHNKTISKICDTLSRLLIQGSQHQMQLHRKKKRILRVRYGTTFSWRET